ncbi:uncharacterized protein YjbI with pentapeptide repeats [Saccharothrix carnea]|uniref:Uncharacterized protein YjbI with pentapeptide repeats n=1 Tax=Saccharothrix carnea TaxID=1280637 RepID=A0A2P8IE43_SACCR|nr:pentapeptide repeat-containing protein [Saccharothrix carnea]PSL56724.1 uncharacterized protein YjbI with pentapeptide repeats [Saccharothrix carnea]
MTGLAVTLWAGRPWETTALTWLGQWSPLRVAIVSIIVGILILQMWNHRSERDSESIPQKMRPLSARSIVLSAIILLGIGITATVLLLKKFGNGTPSEQLDAIRTASTIIIGTGGAAALLLAARRQRATELTLTHQQDVARSTEHDATERRITELFTKAVEQLGSEKFAVRHGGLYALERLAQDNPRHRQTVVNVLCAYLRAPYESDFAPTAPTRQKLRRPYRIQPIFRQTVEASPPGTKSTPSIESDLKQEREVRLAAQLILNVHLRSPTLQESMSDDFWPDIDLDLRGATLIDFDLSTCVVRRANFGSAVFAGTTNFDGTIFTAPAHFRNSRFDENASFEKSSFQGIAIFAEATFNGYTTFAKAEFRRPTSFIDANFEGVVNFVRVQFNRKAYYTSARFKKDASFWRSRFSRRAEFNDTIFQQLAYFGYCRFKRNATFFGSRFERKADFVKCRFGSAAIFSQAHFVTNSDFSHASFQGSTTFRLCHFQKSADFTEAQFKHDASFEQVIFARVANLSDVKFEGVNTSFKSAQFIGPLLCSDPSTLARSEFSTALVRLAGTNKDFWWPLKFSLVGSQNLGDDWGVLIDTGAVVGSDTLTRPTT